MGLSKRFVKLMPSMLVAGCITVLGLWHPMESWGSAPAQVRPLQVVLLTSFGNQVPWYRSQNYDSRTKMEQVFRKAFSDSGYAVVVIHDAEGTDLRQALTSHNTAGVFWVSHASSDTIEARSPIGFKSKIVTSSGKDIKSVFRRVSPYLRFLGIIGCKTKPIIEEFAKRGNYANNPGLTIVTFDKKIDGVSGLKRAIRVAIPAIEESSYEQISPRKTAASLGPTSRGSVLRITRRMPLSIEPEAVTEVQLFLGQHYLGLMASPLPGEVQMLQIELPPEILDGSTPLRLLIDTGLTKVQSVPITFGEFEISLDTLDPAHWKLVANANGVAIGSTSVLYRYRGNP